MWIKSSYSAQNGNCVEAAFTKSSRCGEANCVEVAFAKSSHSLDNGTCVEVAFTKSSRSAAGNACVEVGRPDETCTLVHVRDSKVPDVVLDVTRDAWRALLTSV